jgi:hypothetical protein
MKMSEYKHLRDSEIELLAFASAAKIAEPEYIANGFSARFPLEVMRFGRKVSPDAILALLAEIERLRGALANVRDYDTGPEKQWPIWDMKQIARAALEGTDGD